MTVNALASIVSTVQSDTGLCFNKVNSLEVEVKDIGARLDILLDRLPAASSVPAPVYNAPAPANISVPPPVPHDNHLTNNVTGVHSQNASYSTSSVLCQEPHIPSPAVQCPVPAPQELVRHENRDGRMDNIISKEDYHPAPQSGKHNIAVDTEMPKPFMYLEREGLQTVKQHLDVRNSMTCNEYVHASLSLLRDADAYEPVDRDHIFNHTHDVCADILV